MKAKIVLFTILFLLLTSLVRADDIPPYENPDFRSNSASRICSRA